MLPILAKLAEAERLSKLAMSIPAQHFERKEVAGLTPIKFVCCEAKVAQLFWVCFAL